MAIIDMETMSIETVPANEDEVYARLDELCRELLGMTAEDFIAAIREEALPDHPAAARLEVLARAFI
jgi:hypothetical protein